MVTCDVSQSKDGGGSESEKDEAELMEIDKVLEKHDPKFKKTPMAAKPQMSGQISLGVERCRSETCDCHVTCT